MLSVKFILNFYCMFGHLFLQSSYFQSDESWRDVVTITLTAYRSVDMAEADNEHAY